MTSESLSVVAAARPFPGERVNGDAWTVQWHGTIGRVSVFDGLGHGPEAAAAANQAVMVLQARPELGPAAAMRLCHDALRGTRGAAAWIGCIDLTNEQITALGVGNVEARLWQASVQTRLTSARGIVGAVLPTLREETHILGSDWLLVVHTDGISERFDLKGLTSSRDPQAWADVILERFGRTTDDATVVVVSQPVNTSSPVGSTC